MKTLFYIILTLFTLKNSYGQPENYTQRLVKEIKLKDLHKSSKLIYIRLWSGYDVIEIWLNKDSTVGGQMIFFCFEDNDVVKKYQTKAKRKVYSSSKKIDNQKAEEVFKFILQQKILDIPSGDSIKGWRSAGWADGYSYEIETSIRHQYKFKTYRQPSGQDSTILQAKQLDTFFRSLKIQLDLKLNWDKFIDQLPDGRSYEFDGFGIEKRGKTKKNNR